MNTLMTKSKFTTRNITGIAVMAALSIVLVALIHIPMFLPFLEYDPADIPIFITTFAFGPGIGLILTVIVSVLQGVTVSSAAGIIGIIMHILATGSIIGLACGVAVWTLVMVLWNILITPIFMGVPMEQVLTLILPAILPFNLIKAGLNSVLTFVLYKSVGKLFGVREVKKVKEYNVTKDI
ncbi:MAG: ECF transporter S component [Christensenella sp.]